MYFKLYFYFLNFHNYCSYSSLTVLFPTTETCPQTWQVFFRAFVFFIPFVSHCKAGSFLLSRSQLKSHVFREVFSDHPFLSHSPCPHYTIISPGLIVIITIIAIWKYLNLFNYLFTLLIEYEFPRAETWYALH